MLTNAGIKKVNASIAAALLCDRFQCELIAFPGLAGGVAPGLEVRDLVVATEGSRTLRNMPEFRSDLFGKTRVTD